MEREPLTEDELELLFNAWALAARGKGFAVTEEARPKAERLVDEGWLASERLDNGDLLYRWTATAEAALDLSELTSVAGREN